MAAKYFTVETVATFVHHRGPTTLPGEPPAPAGDTVLCIHDAAGNGNVFGGVLDALAEGRRPIAFDLPGHGRSGGLDSLGAIDAMAAHTHALAERLGLASTVVLGDGMGAAVALELGATWPDLVSAVVLCGSSALLPEPAALDQLRQVTAGRARRQFDTAGYAPDTPREVYQRAFGEWMKTDPRATVGDLQALADWGGARPITAPVTIVVGEHEPAEARAAAERLAAQTNGRVVELAGAGRRGVVEQPQGLAEIVIGVAA